MGNQNTISKHGNIGRQKSFLKRTILPSEPMKPITLIHGKSIAHVHT